MNKLYRLPFLLLTFFFIISLVGCNSTNEKTANFTFIYIITTIFSFLLLIFYWCLIEKKDLTFCLLFACVFIVNLGYLSLAISKTLEEALLANRISYLGSVFLPLTMLMIIMNVCKINRTKIISGILLSISVIVFLIAASPGYLSIYYKNVSLEYKNGVTLLIKEYGSWHKIYLVYLLLYFGLMIATIIYASKKYILKSTIHAFTLLSAVFINIVIWGIEQIIKIDLELLSISYIISELFLLSFSIIIPEHNSFNEKKEFDIEDNATDNTSSYVDDVSTSHINDITTTNITTESTDNTTLCSDSIISNNHFLESQLSSLTNKELDVCMLYISGNKSRDIMHMLNITENTLKYHNKNIYSKLGINSRKQLLELADYIKNYTNL